MAEHTVRLRFPAKPEYLLLARLALAGLARSISIEDETLADLKLAVTEACGNAVRHAYDNGGDEAVTVTYVVDADRLELIVEDEGVGLAAAPVPDRRPEHEALEGGMGMAIIRAVVDELEVRDGAGGRGTVVRMTKRLAGESLS